MGPSARVRSTKRDDRNVSDASPADGVGPTKDDRQKKGREGSERRRKPRHQLTDEMKTAARKRARGICECTSPNCWHFRQCKAPGVAFVAKRSSAGVASCVLFCRECARTSGGREERL